MLATHCRPKPCAFSIAVISLLRSFSFDEYSGNNKALKQVCEVGKRSVSGLALCMISLRADKPSTGALDIIASHMTHSAYLWLSPECLQ